MLLDRLRLIQHLNGLPLVQFNAVVFELQPGPRDAQRAMHRRSETLVLSAFQLQTWVTLCGSTDA
jgi:hypothetical protein